MYKNRYSPYHEQHDYLDLSQVYPFPQYAQQQQNPYWSTNYMPQSPYAQGYVGYPDGSVYRPQLFQQQQPFAAGNPYSVPYPKMNQVIKPKPSQVQSFMSQFKTSDGSYDINKMMNTAGQMMGAVNQLANMVKGMSGIFKV